METITRQLNVDALQIKALLNQLIDCSNIIRWNYSKQVAIPGDYEWESLDESGRKLQIQLLRDYNHFSQILRFLITGLSEEKQRFAASATFEVLKLIQQNGCLYKMAKDDYLIRAQKAIDGQIRLLSALPQGTDDHCFLIPDADALLANPDLEKWDFKDIGPFTLVLLPEIISELDQVTGKNDSAKSKLKSKLAEYSKRGNIKEGVSLAGKNKVRYAADLPTLSPTLPGLDLDNITDRLIAAYFLVVKANPHSPVTLVTNNTDFQKNTLAVKINWIKPPEAKVESKPIQAKSEEAIESSAAMKPPEAKPEVAATENPAPTKDTKPPRPPAEKTRNTKPPEPKTRSARPPEKKPVVPPMTPNAKNHALSAYR